MNMNLPPGVTRGALALTAVAGLGGLAAGCASPPEFDKGATTVKVDEYKDGKAFIHGIAQAAGVTTTFECGGANNNDLEARVTKPGLLPDSTVTSDPTTVPNSKTCNDGIITAGETISIVSEPR